MEAVDPALEYSRGLAWADSAAETIEVYRSVLDQ